MKKALKYIIAALIGAAICCTVIFGKGIVGADSVQLQMKILSDAFTVAGLVLLIAGILIWIARQGTFLGLSYAFRSIFVSLHAKEYRDAHKLSYSEYREKKAGKKPQFLYLILVGIAYILPAIAFTIAYFYV